MLENYMEQIFSVEKHRSGPGSGPSAGKAQSERGTMADVNYSGPPYKGKISGNHCGYCMLFDGDADVRVVSGHTSMNRVRAHCRWGHGGNIRSSTDSACSHFQMDPYLEPFAR